MTAIRLGILGVPLGSLALGSGLAATLLTAGVALSLPETRSPADYASLLPLAEPPAPTEDLAIEPMILHRACDADGITTVVVHGQFTSLEATNHSFAIQLPGKAGSFAAITDARGYFEMRIPRDSFADDLCALDTWHSFSDDQMTLRYFLDFE